METKDHRQIGRDSLFLMADLKIDGLDVEHRIKVRNLSPGGMMGEGPVRVLRGTMVTVNIRNVGWAEGTVAWVQGNRFGVEFREEIDPKSARAPVGQSEDDACSYAHRAPIAVDNQSTLRKV